MRIRKHTRAKLDVLEIYAHLGNDSERVAERFLTNLDQAIHTLTETPMIGRKSDIAVSGYPAPRIWHVPGFEDFLIFYVPSDEELEIVRVLHGKRDIESLP